MVLVRDCHFWVALMRLLLPLPARTPTVVSLLIFQCLPALVLKGGRLRSHAPLFPSLCGLLAGLTLLTVSRAVQEGMNLGLYLLVLCLLLGVSKSSVDDFWSIWGKSVEAGLFGAYCRAGGPTAVVSSAFIGRGLLRVRRRRLREQGI